MKVFYSKSSGGESQKPQAVTNGVNVNIANTALLEAVAAESLDMLNGAIQRGADVNYIVNIKLISFEQYSASIYAKLNILENPKSISGLSVLHIACSYGLTSVVARLLDLGANANYKCHGYLTSLFIACMNGHREIVDRLLDRGANIHEKSSDGETYLHIASTYGHRDIAKVLIERGAVIDEASMYGHTALHLASVKGRVEVAELLVDRGADINTTSRTGWGALLWACYHGHKDVVKMLLVRGANISDTDRDGRLIIEQDRFMVNKEIPPLIQKWPFTMGILVMKGITVYHLMDASTLIELREYLY